MCVYVCVCALFEEISGKNWRYGLVDRWRIFGLFPGERGNGMDVDRKQGGGGNKAGNEGGKLLEGGDGWMHVRMDDKDVEKNRRHFLNASRVKAGQHALRKKRRRVQVGN